MSRRQFLARGTVCCGAALVLGPGVVALVGNAELPVETDVHLATDRTRTRPGWQVAVTLTLSQAVESVRVATMRLGASAATVLAVNTVEVHGTSGRFACAAPMVELTAAERADEAYWLVFAVLDDKGLVRGTSDAVEVVVSPFSMGL